MGDKRRERVLLEEFLLDSGLVREGWAIASAGERPDFTCCGPGTSKVGVEVTEVLETTTGCARAGEADLSGRIRETIAGFLPSVGARGAVIDGHVDGLPRRRSDADGLVQNLREHLHQHGQALAVDRGVVDVSFHFPWGVISRITRLDHLGSVFLMDDRPSAARPATTVRTAPEIEAALETSVLRKVSLASGYDRSFPLWLVLRNPYDHVGCVSDDVRERVSRTNGQVFERVYLYNRKLNTTDASPPQPVVIRVL